MGNQHLAYERYLWFHKEIEQGRHPNARTLADEFGISLRTARRTIDFMRNMLGAPLVYLQERRGYVYGEDFTLPELPLSQAEMLAVLLATNILSATDDGYAGRAIRSFVRKLFSRGSGLGVGRERLQARFSAVLHGHSPSRTGVFRNVSRALLADRLLSLTYRSPLDNQPSRRVVEPHHLQHYMGSWVLLAWCRYRRGWRRFYLSRMERAALLDETFCRRAPGEWEHLLDRAFGIFQGKEIFDVRLRFSARMARWVREQAWHPRQRMEEAPGGGLLLTVPAADLREIRMKVLQFGGDVEVVEPEELRREIAEEIRRMKKIYQGDTG